MRTLLWATQLQAPQAPIETYKTSRRTFLVRSIEKGHEESTVAMLRGSELCDPHPPQGLNPPFLSARAYHSSTPAIRNLPRRTGAASKRSRYPCVPSLAPSRHLVISQSTDDIRAKAGYVHHPTTVDPGVGPARFRTRKAVLIGHNVE